MISNCNPDVISMPQPLIEVNIQPAMSCSNSKVTFSKKSLMNKQKKERQTQFKLFQKLVQYFQKDSNL